MYEQIARLDEVVRRLGGAIVHVKPHGALYNVAVRNAEVARAIAEGVARWNPRHDPLRAGRIAHARRVAQMGMPVAGEAFADRRYEPDGTLRSRKFADALITDPRGGGGAGAALCPRGPGGDHLRARRYSGSGGNSEGLPRGANIVTMRFLIALAFAAPLFAQNCTFVVTPTSFHISADAIHGHGESDADRRAASAGTTPRPFPSRRTGCTSPRDLPVYVGRRGSHLHAPTKIRAPRRARAA